MGPTVPFRAYTRGSKDPRCACSIQTLVTFNRLNRERPEPGRRVTGLLAQLCGPLKRRACGTPSWDRQGCGRARLSFSPEKTACIQLPGPAAAVHATAGSKRRALTRPKDEKTHHSGSRAARGAAGGEEGKRLQSVVAFHPRTEPPEREKLNRRQLVPRWKGESLRTRAQRKKGKRDCWSPRPQRPFQPPASP